ncbi:MAG: ABC transporter permease [Actinobacteria bacterium]|nr:ABC transporter permease [Actinomycetota bacterium]
MDTLTPGLKTALRTIWVLTAHSLRSRYRSLIIWGVALGGLGALYVALYPAMSNLLQQYLEQAPENMQRFMGGVQGNITIQQWLEIEFLNVLVPVALPFLIVTLGARTIAGSEERKTLDLLLSNPFPRWQIIAGALATMGISLAAVLAMTWIFTYAAVPIAGVDLGPGVLASALAALWPFCLLFGALALLLSAFVRRNVFAITIPAVILVATYVINSLAQATESMRPLRFVSLLYYIGHPIQGDFPWIAVLAVLAGTLALFVLAMGAFAKRDVFT